MSEHATSDIFFLFNKALILKMHKYRDTSIVKYHFQGSFDETLYSFSLNIVFFFETEPIEPHMDDLSVIYFHTYPFSNLFSYINYI